MLAEGKYPEDLEENMKFRIWLLQKCETDRKIQSLMLKICSEDIYFFVSVFCWTYNPKVWPYDFPFILYPFQKETLRRMTIAVEEGHDMFIEKSREMGYSWMNVVFQLWAFLFKQWSSLYGSYKQSYVDEQGNLDSHFERIRYVIKRLPKWMIPEGMNQKYMLIWNEENGVRSEIAGDSGQNFGTGGRRKFIIMDEYSYWQFDKNAFRKTADIAESRFFGGTPNGSQNVYGKIGTDHEDYSHMNIEKVKLHWRLHPNKTQEWYDTQCGRRTPEDVARELDISYEASVKGAVYKGFTGNVTIGDFPYNPDLKLYTSWDFGRDMVAIIWWQYDPEVKKYYIIDSFQKSAQKDDPELDITFFSSFITGQMLQNFAYTPKEEKKIKEHWDWRYRYEGHCGDPYNTNTKHIQGQSTIASALKKFKIYISTKTGGGSRTTVRERIMKTQLKLKDICIDEKKNGDLISSMEQSRYPEVSEGAQSTSESYLPIHNENSHFRTSFEYFVDWFTPTLSMRQKAERKEKYEKAIKKLEGRNEVGGLFKK